jgi:hypothetical protein
MARTRVGPAVFVVCSAVALLLWFLPGVPVAEWSTSAACFGHTPTFSPRGVWVVGVEGVPVPAIVYSDGCNTRALAHPSFLVASFGLCGLVAEGVELALDRRTPPPEVAADPTGDDEVH